MIYKIYTDQYVAAIIEGTDKLAKWLNRVPQRTLKKLKIESMTGQESYPVTLIEYEFNGQRSFIHAKNPEQLRKDLTSFGRKILTTYIIKENFYGDPTRPGLDYMGILPHEHENEPI